MISIYLIWIFRKTTLLSLYCLTWVNGEKINFDGVSEKIVLDKRYCWSFLKEGCTDVNPICSRGKKTWLFLVMKLKKGQYTFYPVKLSRFAEKIKCLGNTKISYGGPLWTRSNASSTKNSKVKDFLEGSEHPNFMNPFEYG